MTEEELLSYIGGEVSDEIRRVVYDMIWMDEHNESYSKSGYPREWLKGYMAAMHHVERTLRDAAPDES